MKILRALVELRYEATPGPLYLETIHGHGAERDSHLIPGAIREQYGDNALSFGEDWPTARFVEAALRDIPDAADELARAEEAMNRVEAEASRYGDPHPALTEALAGLRGILSPHS